MDLLEVFLRRRIQPLQYRGHCMWLYCGTKDETRVHPEAVDDATLERWVAAITGNKDNPRGMTWYGHLFPIVILFYPFCFAANWSIDLCFALLFDRPPLNCTRCPMERKRQMRRRKEVEAKARRSGIQMLMTTVKTMTLLRRKRRRRRRKLHLLVRKDA